MVLWDTGRFSHLRTSQVLFYTVGPPFVVWKHLKGCAVVLFCINLKNKKSLISDRSHQQVVRKALKGEGTALTMKSLLVVPAHPLLFRCPGAAGCVWIALLFARSSVMLCWVSAWENHIFHSCLPLAGILSLGQVIRWLKCWGIGFPSTSCTVLGCGWRAAGAVLWCRAEVRNLAW